uniref:Protein kinase domain-containing protein n=1 Tax=viral metagenome TaxID=1070528 RepID=A0A6C0KSA5_9ZZZZ
MDIIENVSLLYLMCALSTYMEDKIIWKAKSIDELLDKSEKILKEIYRYNGPEFSMLSSKPETSIFKQFYTARSKPQISPQVEFLQNVQIKDIWNDRDLIEEYHLFTAGYCHTDQFLTLLLQFYSQFMKTNYNFETGFSKNRFDNTLKTFFLLFTLGGKKAMNVQIQLTDILCVNNSQQNSLLGFNKLSVGQDFSCLNVYFSEEMYKSDAENLDSSLMQSFVVINENKFIEHFKFPYKILPKKTQMNCNNPILAECITHRLILFQNCDELMKKGFCTTTKLCNRLTALNRFPSLNRLSLTDEFNLVMASYGHKLLEDVYPKIQRFLNAELKQKDLDYHCPLFTPDWLTNPSNFNGNNYESQIQKHFQILEEIRAHDGECKDAANLIDDLQQDVVLLSDWPEINFSRRVKRAYTSTSCTMRHFLKKYKDDFLKLSAVNAVESFKNLDIEVPHLTQTLSGTLLSSDTLQGLVWTLKLKDYEADDTILAIMKYDKLHTADGEEISEATRYKISPFEKNANLLHEIVVGLALNKLKGTVNNFMYTFGGFICSPPKEDSFESMCDNTDTRNMRIIQLTEFIKNDGSFGQWLNSGRLTRHEIIKILLQLTYALHKAQESFNSNFVHGDLHSGNVLIISLKKGKEQQILFEVNGQSIQFSTIFVPVIIDYGFSIIEKDGKLLIPFMSDHINAGDDFKVVNGKKEYKIFPHIIEEYKAIFQREFRIEDMELTKENFDIARLIISMGIDFTEYNGLIGVNCADTILNLYQNLSTEESEPLIFPMNKIVQYRPVPVASNVFSQQIDDESPIPYIQNINRPSWRSYFIKRGILKG